MSLLALLPIAIVGLIAALFGFYFADKERKETHSIGGKVSAKH